MFIIKGANFQGWYYHWAEGANCQQNVVLKEEEERIFFGLLAWSQAIFSGFAAREVKKWTVMTQVVQKIMRRLFKIKIFIR